MKCGILLGGGRLVPGFVHLLHMYVHMYAHKFLAILSAKANISYTQVSVSKIIQNFNTHA